MKYFLHIATICTILIVGLTVCQRLDVIIEETKKPRKIEVKLEIKTPPKKRYPKKRYTPVRTDYGKSIR